MILRASRAKAPIIVVVTAAAVFACTYVLLDVNAYHALRTGQNTGLYLQSLVNVMRGAGTFDQNDGRPHLAVHDQWLPLVLAPVVALWPSAITLMVTQVVLLGAAAPVLYAFCKARGASDGTAACIAIAYLLAPSTQGWAYHPFVPEDALPLCAFALALALARGWVFGAAVAAQLILGIKEDEALFLAWIGAYLTIFVERRAGLAIVALALVNGAAYFGFDRSLGYVPERPAYGATDRDAGHQLAFLAEVLAPLGFAPLGLGPAVVLALPFLAELFLAQDRSYPLYQAGSYYTIPFVTLATAGAAIVLARRPRFARIALGCAAVMALFFNTTVLHLGRRPFTHDPQFAAAARYARTTIAVDFPCADAGAWTVAASDPNARLACPGTATAGVLPDDRREPRPAWRDVPLDSHAAWTR